MTGLHLISTQTDPSPVLFPYPPTQSKHCHLLWHKFERSLFFKGGESNSRLSTLLCVHRVTLCTTDKRILLCLQEKKSLM